MTKQIKVADYRNNEGYCRLKAENERLREWIRAEGMRSDTCTFDVLGEICEGCRCKRFYAKPTNLCS